MSVLDLYHRLLQAYVGLGWPAELALTVVVPTLTFVFGVAVVLYLPSDYFVRGTGDVTSPRRHEVVRVTVRILKAAETFPLCTATRDGRQCPNYRLCWPQDVP